MAQKRLSLYRNIRPPRKGPPWPERDLASDPVALEFFKQLCECCEREALQFILARIVTPELRRRDFWEQAGAGLSLDEIDSVAKKARQLVVDARNIATQVDGLRHSIVVKQLVEGGHIARGDALHPSTSPKSLLLPLGCLTQIDDLVRELAIGPGKRPDFHEDVEHLVQLVKKSTGRFYDQKLEQILGALGFTISLKQYRADRRKRDFKAGKKDPQK